VAPGDVVAPGDAPWRPGEAVDEGVGDGVGLGGSTENLGSVRGGTTTTPTTPSAVSSANGRTSASLVSELLVPSSLVMTPTGTPGA
jgi:hypothetical protein